MSDIRASAKALGRRGGQARARRLPAEERRRIAALGGAARSNSLAVERRIVDNFSYLTAVKELAEGPRHPARLSTFKGPLPGLYPARVP